jgi:hypothetical protein
MPNLPTAKPSFTTLKRSFISSSFRNFQNLVSALPWNRVQKRSKTPLSVSSF